jgi:hypothetical protein
MLSLNAEDARGVTPVDDAVERDGVDDAVERDGVDSPFPIPLEPPLQAVRNAAVSSAALA